MTDPVIIEDVRPFLSFVIPLIGVLGIVWAGEIRKNLRETCTFIAAFAQAAVVLSMIPDVLGGAIFEYHVWQVFTNVPLLLRVDGPGLLFASVASVLWIATTVYAIGYMRGLHEHAQTRFYSFFAISLSATMGVAFSANLLTIYFFYEMLSVSTFPLVTHMQDKSARTGGRTYLGYLLFTSLCLLLPALSWCYVWLEGGNYQSGHGGNESEGGGEQIHVLAPGNGTQIDPHNNNILVGVNYASSGGAYQTPKWAYMIDSPFPATYQTSHGGTEVNGHFKENFMNNGQSFGQHTLYVTMLEQNGSLKNPPLGTQVSFNYQSSGGNYQSGAGGNQSQVRGDQLFIVSPGNGTAVDQNNDGLLVNVNYASPGGGYQTPKWAYKIDSPFPTSYQSSHGGTVVDGHYKTNFMNGQSFGQHTVYVTMLEQNGNLKNPPLGAHLSFNYQSQPVDYQSERGQIAMDFLADTGKVGSFSQTTQIILLILFTFGFAKAGIMPLHSWLPGAMVAPTPVSALLHAVAVVKVGVFCLYRVYADVFGFEVLRSMDGEDWMIALACATILISSLIALSQDNLKRRLAFSTIGQLGYVALGVTLATQNGAGGSVLHIAMHACGKITLFFCAGAIFVATGKKYVSELRGLGRKMPITMGAFMIGSLSVIGLPPLGGFVSKWYLALGALDRDAIWVVAVLLVSSMLNVFYLLPVAVTAFFRTEETEEDSGIKEAPWPCVVPLALTALGCFALFFLSGPLLRLAGIAP